MSELKVKRAARRNALRGFVGGRLVKGRDAEYLRAIIQAEDHLKTLNKVALGKCEIPAQQFEAAKYLLNKVLPNLATLKVTSSNEQKLLVFNMPVVAPSAEQWEANVEEHRALAAKPVNGHAGNGS